MSFVAVLVFSAGVSVDWLLHGWRVLTYLLCWC